MAKGLERSLSDGVRWHSFFSGYCSMTRQHRALCVLIPSLPLLLGSCAGPASHHAGGSRAIAERIRERNAEEARPDAPFERQQFFLERRLPAGQKVFPVDAWFRAEQQMRNMPRHDPRTTLSTSAPRTAAKTHDAPGWEWVGPGNVAGRTRALAFDPRDPSVMFAAGVSGGVWKSTDAGGHWSPLSDDAVNLNIGALVIDPDHPDVMYAGTGELYRNTGRPWSPMTGAGILKSSDGGRTWNRLLATDSDDFLYVSDIVLSPHDSKRIYAATNSGIWRSNDGGVTFTRVLRPENEQGVLEYEGCNDLLIRDDRPTDWVLASCSSRSTDDRYWLPNTVTPPACDGPCPAAVFLNRDAAGDGAWNQVLSEPGQGRTEMAAFKGNESIIYASSASIIPDFDRTGDGHGDYDNGLHAIFRSDDGGQTWEARLRNDDEDALSTYLMSYADGFESVRCNFGNQPFTYGAGWYNNAIAVDPVKPNVVWVAGMDIYRSDDGGRSFGMASHWFLNNNDPELVHADQHLLKFHPDYDGVNNRLLYTANDGGIAVASNARAPVDTGIKAACGPTTGSMNWQALNRGLGTTQFYDGQAWPDGSRYVGGAQDNGTLLGDDRNGPNLWNHIFGGDGGVVALRPDEPDTFFLSYQNGNIQRTEDGGRHVTAANAGLQDASIFIMPYLIDPNEPTRLFAGGTRLWRSDDEGRQWHSVSAALDGFDFGTRISALAVAPGDSNHILIANQHAIYFRFNALDSDNRTHWSSRSPREGWVSSLVFDPLDANVVYATYSTFGGAHVWKSTNGGKRWSPLDGSGDGALPDVPVHDLAVDPNDTSHLYIGTDLGIFVSLDGGAHWAVENTGFANVITESLDVADSGNGAPQLFAFTYGRGVWRVPLGDLDGKPDHRIGPEDSGLWDNPDQDGHGMFFEVIKQDGVPKLLASWYVYLDGEQRWLTGVGSVDADTATVPLSITDGGDFPPDFDPGSVSLKPWGTLMVEFESDRTAHAEWSSDYPGFNDGALDLRALVTPLDPADDPPGARVRACDSGSWYNTNQPGHGFQLQVVSVQGQRQVLAVWYAYLDGHQVYLVGNGPIENGEATVDFYITAGGEFPPDFDPLNVSKPFWGTATFSFTDADHGHVAWHSELEGFSDGQLDLTRLTRQLGRECD